MRVVTLHPNSLPNITDIEDDLQTLQTLVGGYIEIAVRLPGNVAVYCNEDGMRLGLSFTCTRPTDGHPLVGTLVAVKADEEGDHVDMTEAEAVAVRKEMLAWLFSD